MKASTLLIFLFSLAINLIAQEISINPNKMNIAYIGVDNPITIMVNGIDCKELIIDVSQGELEYDYGCSYLYKPKETGKAIFNIFHKSKQVGTYEYRIKEIPLPISTLGGKIKGGSYSKEAIMGQIGIIAFHKDLQMRIHIKSFTMVICSNGNYHISSTNGSILSAEMKGAISKISDYSKVIFTEIKILNPDGSEKMSSDIELNIYRDREKNYIADCNGLEKNINISNYITDDTLFTKFTCPCNYEILKIETDRIAYKGLNNDFFFSSNTLNTDSSKTYLEYYENGQIATEKNWVTKNYMLKCQDQNSWEQDKLHLSKYLEYYKNAIIKVQGSYALKETVNNITDEEINDISRLTGCGTISKCNYVEDVKNGNWDYFNEFGKLIKREVYELGELTSTNDF